MSLSEYMPIRGNNDVGIVEQPTTHPHVQSPLPRDILTGIDLSGVDLRGVERRAANLSGANLSGANLRGANLIDANLHNADLHDADLTGAPLSQADADDSEPIPSKIHRETAQRLLIALAQAYRLPLGSPPNGL